MIYEKLKNGSILDNLANLASLVNQRAQELVPAYGYVTHLIQLTSACELNLNRVGRLVPQAIVFRVGL